MQRGESASQAGRREKATSHLWDSLWTMDMSLESGKQRK